MIARRVRALGAKRLGAYAATWIIWGSTYLAIRTAVAVVPPFLLAGVRSVLAGSILVGWALLQRDERPRRGQVFAALATGVLFFLIGHGGLFWAEQRVASGPAALMIATEHFWVLLAGSLLGIVAATWRAWAGVAIGLGGVALLVGSGTGGIDPVGAAVLIVSAAAWGLGTLYFTGPRKPKSQPYAAGIPLLGGGVLLLAASAISGETARFSVADVTPVAAGALLYLVLFGSVVAFTAYSWLVEREGPSRALSFTYVNPLVAVLLGAAFLSEPLTWRIALAAGAIVASVVLIITGTKTSTSTASPAVTPAPVPVAKRRRPTHLRARRA
ncbi:MAG TPA: EamA family transporter [Longimicrobium sp.]